MGFFDYLNAQNNNSVATMDEEKMITIRRIFKIDPKVQKELGKEPSESDKEQTSAEDQAIFVGGIAMDLSPRHSKTPIEKCRAKDPRYCPYHGADFMTAQLNEAFKKKGIYAAGAVERMSQGKFKIQYSVPESKRDAANAVIDEFLTSPGFVELDEKKDDKIIDKIDKEMGEDVGKGFKMDRPNDEFALKEEHLDTLEEDMNKGMNIDPSELYQLRKDHHELKKIAKAAYEAAEEEGIDASSGTKEVREWKEMSPDWQKYREARAKYEKDYNAIRGNADLAHIESLEDCKELMDHLEKQITQIGDFVKETDEIAAIKAAKGMTGKRKIGDRKIEGTTAFNDAKGAIRFTIDGLKSARKQVEEAKESGDIKKMRAAAHSLELVLHEVGEKKDEIAHALEQARSYKAHLLTFPGPDGLEKPAEKKEEPSASEKKEEKPEAPAKKEDPKTEEKKEEPEGDSKKMTDDEYKKFFTGKQYELKSMMKSAGFEEALELKKKIEEEEGKDIFDISGLGDAASECFQTGLYEVWEGKGVDDMLSIVKDFPDCEGDAETVFKTYVDAIDGIKKFIAKAKQHLKTDKKDEHGLLWKDYEEAAKKYYKHFAKEKIPDGELEEVTSGMSSYLDRFASGDINPTPSDESDENDMWVYEGVVEALGSDHPYAKKMGEYVSGLKDSFKEYMALREEALGKPTTPKEYEAYLKTKDGEEEIKRIAEGWSNPAGTFKANPRLAKCLKRIMGRHAPYLKISHLWGVPADDLKAGSSSASSSSAAKPEKPAVSKKDEYGFSGKDYEEVVDKFLKKHKGEKAASETSDHDRKLYTGTISEFMDKAGKGSISLAPADGGKTSNDMQFLKDIREAVGSDHPYVKKMDEYVNSLKGSFKKVMEAQEEASGEKMKPSDYASYLKSEDGKAEIKKIEEGWSDPAGVFSPNPRLAAHLSHIAKEPKAKVIEAIAGLMGMSADDLKAGTSSSGASSASKSDKPATPKSAAAEYLDGVFKDKFIKRYGADRFEKIDKLASKAKAEGKTAIGRSGWDDYEDADEDRYESIKSLVRKMGGTIESEGGGEEENERYFHFSGIPPEKMHELYAKIDARGGMLPW